MDNLDALMKQAKTYRGDRLSIRPHVYRRKSGFLVCGTCRGNRIRIFAQTRSGAEDIREAENCGDFRAVNRILIAGG